MSQTEHEALTAAAQTALLAPSIFNTQPWLWRIDANTLELYADRDRTVVSIDPHGRMLLLSCGASLHHARVALAAAGWRATVDRLPDPDDPDLLARIRLAERAEPDGVLADAVTRRRSDRRPYSDEPVSDVDVQRLVDAAERNGARLHDVRLAQMPMLAVAVAGAQAAELTDANYRNELMRWTNRPQWSDDGVPQGTGVAHVARRVPIRDFVFSPNQGITVEPGGDRGARYLVVFGDTDEPIGWLRAGEAASAVLLTAASLGLAAAPISDVIEVEHPRDLVRALLPAGGFPYLVVRCGHQTETEPITATPRRGATEAVRGPRS
jgi:nitroreductase